MFLNKLKYFILLDFDDCNEAYNFGFKVYSMMNESFKFPAFWGINVIDEFKFLPSFNI